MPKSTSDDAHDALDATRERHRPALKAETPAQLYVFSDRGSARHPLPSEGSVTIGRAEQATIRIDDPEASRVHAALHLVAKPGGELEVELEDLGSANGTVLRGQPLPEGQRRVLAASEAFEIGDTTLLVQYRAGAAPLGRGSARASSAMAALAQTVERIAPSDITVLILGETGVGKEVMAERIHNKSPRAGAALLSLNCAAISESLLESELFGHARGAYTGADEAKPGLLESAAGGTVFLDEIGELPPATQVKLLRVLEERQVLRVGEVKPRAIDVRFLAATNRDLEQRVAEGGFRADLYYRLNGVALFIPPLRERRSEIDGLVSEFVAQAAARAKRSAPATVSNEALELLRSWSWPGNIRELKNVVERAVLLAGDGPIAPEHLQMRSSPAPAQNGPSASSSDERQRIVDALHACVGNQTRAAALLGIARSTLVARIQAYDIPRPRKRGS